MSPSSPILAQSLESLGQGVYLLIGILVFGFFAGIVALIIYVAIRAWIFQVRQRRSQEAYLKRTRRADGKTYPPRGGGICQQCGRVRKFVFFLPTGEMFCPECYEAWWPIAEAKKAQADLQAATDRSETATPLPARSPTPDPVPAPRQRRVATAEP